VHFIKPDEICQRKKAAPENAGDAPLGILVFNDSALNEGGKRETAYLPKHQKQRRFLCNRC
jgi:hypothetical protein